jgi:hypothetical protein
VREEERRGEKVEEGGGRRRGERVVRGERRGEERGEKGGKEGIGEVREKEGGEEKRQLSQGGA